MAQPKKRHSNSRQNKRRFSNYRLKSKSSSVCPSCGAPILPHHACPSCGTYKGRVVKPPRQARGKEKK
ncbi:MAG: 50S ribosomal protein L32 [Candidatus Margulisbacteria bacterium]|nr:50S ribosomal protein L32 [Candidatus Margulisiibacteriota bacterium]